MSTTPQGLSDEEKQRKIEEAIETTEYILKESKRLEHEMALNTTKQVMLKLEQIEQNIKEIK